MTHSAKYTPPSAASRLAALPTARSQPRWVLLASAALVAGAAWAPRAQAQNPEMGRVLSSVPVVQQTAVPRQVCTNEQVTVPGQKSGAGALLGGVAGGAIGNQIGGGSGRAAATMLGLVGGAMLGNSIEGGGQPQTQWAQRCTTQTVYENQTVGYNVTYEYAGKQYTVQMAQDPGPWVRLQVTPVAAPPATYQQPYNPNTNYNTYPSPQSGYYQPEVQPSVSYVSPAVYTQETTYIVPAPVYVRPYPPVVAPSRASIRVDLSNQRDPDRWREPHPQRSPQVNAYPIAEPRTRLTRRSQNDEWDRRVREGQTP